jgi:hypothetical protein
MTPTLSQAEKEANLLAVARLTVRELGGASYPMRRRGVLYVATVLGHTMGPEEVREQPWGSVGACAHCGQIAKAKRDGDGIEGRAVETICPANRP